MGSQQQMGEQFGLPSVLAAIKLTAVLAIGNEVPVSPEAILQVICLFAFGVLFFFPLFLLFFLLLFLVFLFIITSHILCVLGKGKNEP